MPTRPFLPLALNALLVLLPLSASADSSRPDADDAVATFSLGLLLGGGFYQANSPTDPPGSTTFLFGSAFTGGGFSAGLTALADLRRLPLGVGVDALFSSTRISGFAESGPARRDVTLSEQTLRLFAPNLRLYAGLPFGQWELALGPEWVIALAAGTTEEVRGIDPEARPLEPRPTNALFLVAQTGLTFDVGALGPFDEVSLPLVVRAGWNPAYPDRTDERFADFSGPEAPGPLSIGADWYVSGLVGIRFGVLVR